jgi:hypothetical protein
MPWLLDKVQRSAKSGKEEMERISPQTGKVNLCISHDQFHVVEEDLPFACMGV